MEVYGTAKHSNAMAYFSCVVAGNVMVKLGDAQFKICIVMAAHRYEKVCMAMAV